MYTRSPTKPKYKNMKEFYEMSCLEKRDALDELYGKNVEMVYDYPDIPSGKIGPEIISGRILSVQFSSFRLETSNGESIELSIDGIVEIKRLADC